jgi:glucoamylase
LALEIARFQYSLVRPAVAQSDLISTGPYMFWLMFRNVVSNGFVFESPPDGNNQPSPAVQSQPGCILASPAWENTGADVNQDYVFNWTRDAAVVAIELAAGPLPTDQPLIDYVQFAQTCQNSASAFGHFDRASFFINGTPRTYWTDQTDGPALQTLAILQMYAQLDAPTQAVAGAVIAANLNFLQNAYQGETVNLWEEETGVSFFARSVQLECFQAISANSLGIGVPGWLSTAIPWLQNALASHWNGQYYQSLLPAPTDSKAPYDPNIDIVLAATYGAVPVTDTKLLATAGQLRSQWADPASPNYYPINGYDQQLSSGPVGPLLGRYPGDTYDGDTNDPATRDHPWALSTANFAALYYRLAQEVTSTGTVPLDSLSATFFSQIGVDASTTPKDAAASLESYGDQMMQALLYHSDHFELSEQFDAWTGYEKSVSDLSWSYAAFLSALRAKNAI